MRYAPLESEKKSIVDFVFCFPLPQTPILYYYFNMHTISTLVSSDCARRSFTAIILYIMR